jgi:hypothetical protein
MTMPSLLRKPKGAVRSFFVKATPFNVTGTSDSGLAADVGNGYTLSCRGTAPRGLVEMLGPG